jgi:tRNA A37 threonylcarbamoyladenosine biosynthesis protein TsaE
MSTLSLHLPDAQATTRAGAALAPCLRGGMVVTLQGDLGSG